MPNIELALVICNQDAGQEKVVRSLLKCGLNAICCVNLQEARTLLPQEAFRVVLCKEQLSDGDFRVVLREVKKSNALVPVIVLSRATNWDSYLKAIGDGVFDYIICPPNPVETETIIWSALADTMDADERSRATV